MKKIVVMVIAAAAVLMLEVRAQDARSVIDASAKAMGADGLQSLQYSGTGTNNSLGQAATPGGPWPRFRVTKYLALVDYTVPAMRQEVVRIDNESPPRGGGAGGFNAATGQGGIRPVPGDVIQNQNTDGRTDVGALNIWLTPHGFLKGAAANAATARLSAARGRKVVSFTAFGKYTVTGAINDQNLVERVETHIDNNFTGDTLVEGIYSDYRDFGGVKFPMRIVMRQGGHPTLELTVAAVQPNSPVNIQLAAAPAPAPVRMQPERIAEGVWFLAAGTPQSILVEFNDHVVMIEGPSGDERTQAAIAEARRMLPNKPIRYVVNTHSHADHAGGIRAYVAEGIPIITHEAHKRYYEEQIFGNPHTLNPDRLARSPRAPVIEAMKDKRVLTDGTMTIELHHVRGNPHSEGLLMAYLPQEKLLIQADAFAPRPGAPPLPAPSPYTVNFLDNIQRLNLDVARVVHVHGGIDPLAAVVRAAGR